MGDLYETAIELPDEEEPLEDEDLQPSFEEMKSKQATKQSVLHDCLFVFFRCFFACMNTQTQMRFALITPTYFFPRTHYHISACKWDLITCFAEVFMKH